MEKIPPGQPERAEGNAPRTQTLPVPELGHLKRAAAEVEEQAVARVESAKGAVEPVGRLRLAVEDGEGRPHDAGSRDG
jgi:hypothetical protein